MTDFNSFLEQNPYVQKKKEEGREEGRAEGRAEGHAEGLAEGMQNAVVTIIEGRFPPLAELAQEKVKRISRPDLLNILLKQIIVARDEEMARLLLDTFAA